MPKPKRVKKKKKKVRAPVAVSDEQVFDGKLPPINIFSALQMPQNGQLPIDE